MVALLYKNRRIAFTFSRLLQEKELEGIPTAFSLSQNYPNPFNRTTVIGYQSPANSHVTLKNYDVLGREVATLVDGRQDAGYYNVTFNAVNMSSGVYFYRIAADKFNSVKKLVLIKQKKLCFFLELVKYIVMTLCRSKS
ncbi:MAG: T9SS type A sorting domain-containing protein [Candidatus Kryptoniota bacterium]